MFHAEVAKNHFFKLLIGSGYHSIILLTCAPLQNIFNGK